MNDLNDCISREKVIEIINEFDLENRFNSWNDYSEMHDLISELPAADVRHEIHGYWSAENERPKSVMYRCSVCGQIAHDRPFGSTRHYVKKECSLAYCPHCGAKMDGGKTNA